MAAVNYYYDFTQGRFLPEFAATNPFKAALHDTVKRVLEEQLPTLQPNVLSDLESKQLIVKSAGRWKIVGQPIQQKVHLDPRELVPELARNGFSEIQLIPAPEQYSLTAKEQLAYLTNSLSFYWGILRKFAGQEPWFIRRVFDELKAQFPDGQILETDIFVTAEKP
jgi:hypothetical protein